MQENIQNTVSRETQIPKEELQSSIAKSIEQVKADEIKTSQNTTTVQLPSNGLLNPNIKEVTLRRMTVKESKTLYTSSDGDYLATLIKGCIVDPVNITLKDLHPNDIIYLSFILRYISSPKKVMQKAICQNPKCRKVFTHQVDINNLKVKYATPDEYNYLVKLPDCGSTVKFKILSEYEITNCEKIATRRARQENVDDTDWYTLTSKIAYMITDIDNEPQEDMDKKLEFIESLSAYDFESFNKAYNDITSTFGLNRSFYEECPHCKEDVEVEAYIAPDFFQLV